MVKKFAYPGFASLCHTQTALSISVILGLDLLISLLIDRAEPLFQTFSSAFECTVTVAQRRGKHDDGGRQQRQRQPGPGQSSDSPQQPRGYAERALAPYPPRPSPPPQIIQPPPGSYLPIPVPPPGYPQYYAQPLGPPAPPSHQYPQPPWPPPPQPTPQYAPNYQQGGWTPSEELPQPSDPRYNPDHPLVHKRSRLLEPQQIAIAQPDPYAYQRPLPQLAPHQDPQAQYYQIPGNAPKLMRARPGQERVVGKPGFPPPAPKREARARFREEDDNLLKELKDHPDGLSWKQIGHFFPGRNSATLQVRFCTKLKKKEDIDWTEDREAKLERAVEDVEAQRWKAVAQKLGAEYTPEACKEHYNNMKTIENAEANYDVDPEATE